MPTVPAELISRRQRVIRPRDLRDRYRNPTAELTRLERAGIAKQVAYGYYVLIPAEFVGSDAWRPSIEALALGVAVADYGPAQTAVMGISAARLLGIVPRALALGSVAVPGRRPELETEVGTIVFHTRDTAKLALRRVDTDLAVGYQTTREQTLLDLIRFRSRWNISDAVIDEAVGRLSETVHVDQVRDLARRQRCLWVLDELGSRFDRSG